MTDAERVTAGAQITKVYYEAITRLVQQGKYLSESEFVRQAIIEKLKREGALNNAE